jgi:hypothetical protein
MALGDARRKQKLTASGQPSQEFDGPCHACFTSATSPCDRSFSLFAFVFLSPRNSRLLINSCSITLRPERDNHTLTASHIYIDMSDYGGGDDEGGYDGGFECVAVLLP